MKNMNLSLGQSQTMSTWTGCDTFILKNQQIWEKGKHNPVDIKTGSQWGLIWIMCFVLWIIGSAVDCTESHLYVYAVNWLIISHIQQPNTTFVPVRGW